MLQVEALARWDDHGNLILPADWLGLAEETGLTPADFARAPGYVLARSGPLLAIAVEWQSAVPAQDLRERIAAHIRSLESPELADMVIVRSPTDIGAIPVQEYALSLLRHVMVA